MVDWTAAQLAESFLPNRPNFVPWKEWSFRISECGHGKKSSGRKPGRFHLNYPDIVSHRPEIRAKRVVLTHFSPEMLSNLESVREECAHDGLVIQL